MAAAPLAALDLPLKVLVWADGHQTKLSYAEPAELAARYGLSDELDPMSQQPTIDRYLKTDDFLGRHRLMNDL